MSQYLNELKIKFMSYKTPILEYKMAIYLAFLHESGHRLLLRVKCVKPDGRSIFWEVSICRPIREVAWSEDLIYARNSNILTTWARLHDCDMKQLTACALWEGQGLSETSCCNQIQVAFMFILVPSAICRTKDEQLRQGKNWSVIWS
jgi:hypothetical protein